MIPLCDLNRQYLSLQDEINSAMQEVASQSRFILGPNVKAFENEMASYCQTQYAVGVGSGTDALHLALRALKIGPGDEVITTPFTFIATTEAIGMVGAEPVFADIDPETYNIDPAQIEKSITSKTRAILPVHLYGQPCDMSAIMAIAEHHDLFVIEDCAQALGATYQGKKAGSIGDIGCLSFFPSKNLGAMGDGGMVLTKNRQLYERVEMLRRHGGNVKYYHSELGLNSRLDELQAAILRVKLKHLNSWNERRRLSAYQYNRQFSDFSFVKLPGELTCNGAVAPSADSTEISTSLLKSVYHQYTIRTTRRDSLIQDLRRQEIGHAVYYPVPLHLQEVHASLGYRKGDFPCAEQVSSECLSLPMCPELTIDNLLKTTVAVKESLSPSHSESSRKRTAA